MPDYIHSTSAGSFEHCQKSAAQSGEILFNLYRETKISGYLIFVVSRPEDLPHELMDTNYRGLTKDLFPFVVSNVREIKGIGFDLEDLMKSLDFEILQKLTATISAPQSQI